MTGEPAPPVRRRVTPYAAGVVVLFAAYPFVSFLNRNRAELTDVSRLFWYAVVTAAFGLAVVVAFVLIRPRGAVDPVAVGVAVFLLCFFGFHLLFEADPFADRRVPQLISWGGMTLVLVGLSVWLARYAGMRTFVLMLGAMLTALPLAQYVTWRITTDRSSDSVEAETAAGDEPAPEVEDPPNVYLFVLDEYARNDNMSAALGYDNEVFYEELRDRGYVVAEGVHAPFQQTIMSMASVFEMDYIATTHDEAAGGSVAVTDRLRGDNATVDYFRSLGYDYAYSPPGLYSWNRCVPDLVDLCIEPDGKGLYLDELDLSLLDLTPIGSLDLVREAVTDPDYVVDRLYAERDRIDEPVFFYAHVVSPHWPYRYDEACELRSRFVYPPLLLNKSDDDLANYLQDVGCLNQRVLDGLDRIAEEDPEGIVVLMSDHGSKFIPDGSKRLEEWRPEAKREEFGVLYAVRVPERCRADVEATTNSVNTFRVVSACIEERAPDLVEDRAFLWPHTGLGPQELDDLAVLDPVP